MQSRKGIGPTLNAMSNSNVRFDDVISLKEVKDLGRNLPPDSKARELLFALNRFGHSHLDALQVSVAVRIQRKRTGSGESTLLAKNPSGTTSSKTRMLNQITS